MASITYHRKPNGTTYVYRQESYWDKGKKRPANRQVCIGKLADDGGVIYNKRFKDPDAREALERGERVAESALCGQSLVIGKATAEVGVERVLRRCFDPRRADALISLAQAVSSGAGAMYLAAAWIEQNECAAHEDPPTSQDVSRILASVSQSEIEVFLKDWAGHRKRGLREQYCYDIASVSSADRRDPFIEYGHDRGREDMAQADMALLTGVTSRIPTYYELSPGPVSDTKTLQGFLRRMDRYGIGTIRTLLDRGFYSSSNIDAMLDGHIGFYIPVPSDVRWSQALIDESKDALEMPEHIIWAGEDGLSALYGMTATDKVGGRRVWKHVYFDTARRTEHIASFLASLKRWEAELSGGEPKEANQWAYDAYFTVKSTPKRGLRVRMRQDAVNAYKADRAGYWVVLTNCEKDAAKALSAYRERSLVESQFDDMRNEPGLSRLRTHGPDTMRGRAFVQFLALVITAQLRVMLDAAWEARMDTPKEDRLARRYPLNELMLRLGSYRKTSFPGRYGPIVSVPTKAQRSIFLALGIDF